MSRVTIALLGQPNSGKSTLFNTLTGSRQHVGNWPGKTVEKKEGVFHYKEKKYTLVDLPGTYSLSATSQEEIVTRDYISGSDSDLICILADASQLERSLYMLADYAGIRKPVVLLLNMMDVAEQQGKSIDCKLISQRLGIPVVPITATDKKCYEEFFQALDRMQGPPAVLKEMEMVQNYEKTVGESYNQILELIPEKGIDVYSPAWLASKLVEQDVPVIRMAEAELSKENWEKMKSVLQGIQSGNLLTGEAKFRWVESLLKDSAVSNKTNRLTRSRFDRIATSKTWGKPLALLITLLGFIISMAIAMPFMGLIGFFQGYLAPFLAQGLFSIGTSSLLVSLVCDGVLTAVVFALMMVSFVFGISLVFGFLEEIGYMARISYVFDNSMAKLGLQGKAVMPFLVSFGCNIGGVTGTRVIDSWGQRVMAMALSWVVPCAATWSVVGLVSSVFFGSGAFLVILSLFVVAFLHLIITSKLFGRALIDKDDRCGMIMELPPYHKPKYRNLFRFVFNRMGDVLKRALSIIILVAVVFWALSYTADGSVENSIIYKIGIAIEPVTMWFGLRWQTFMAFAASAMGKEAALGVLASLFSTTGQTAGIWGAVSGSAAVSTTGLGGALLAGISKAEALAFIYAFFFNVPCLMAIATTQQESHSMKWTLRIAGYYIAAALLTSAVAYRVGLLIF